MAARRRFRVAEIPRRSRGDEGGDRFRRRRQGAKMVFFAPAFEDVHVRAIGAKRVWRIGAVEPGEGGTPDLDGVRVDVL